MTTTTKSTSPLSAPGQAAEHWPAGSRRPAFPWSPLMRVPTGARWRISPPMSPSKPSCIGRMIASSMARTRCNWAATTVASRSAGVRSISRWCRCGFAPNGSRRARKLGYGVDWPLDWREMWHYYAEVEDALKIAGPVTYPWGPHRPRYPYRAHELNAAAKALARGCEAMGIKWTETPLATLSAPRGLAHPCVYRGFCVTGCSTNAKQSVLVTWLPRAIAASAEIRDLAMVGRVETNMRVSRPACTTTAADAGGSRRRATWWSPATRSRRHACC